MVEGWLSVQKGGLRVAAVAEAQEEKEQEEEEEGEKEEEEEEKEEEVGGSKEAIMSRRKLSSG